MGNDLDSRLLQGDKLAGPAQEGLAGRNLREEQNKAKQTGGGVEDSVGEDEQNWRQKLAQVRKERNAKNAKEEVEKKIATPSSMLKTKLLNLIPGYGPCVVFKQAVLMKKNKFILVDVIIMLFSNLSTIFIILIAIAAFFMLIDLVTGWFGWII